MSFTYGDTDFIRKVRSVKDNLWADNFYNSTIVCRTITVHSGSGSPSESGFFRRTSVISQTDTTVKGIVEFGPFYVNHDNVVESIGGDVRLAVRVQDASNIFKANRLYISGVKYQIRSDKPALLGYDHIFVLTVASKTS